MNIIVVKNFLLQNIFYHEQMKMFVVEMTRTVLRILDVVEYSMEACCWNIMMIHR